MIFLADLKNTSRVQIYKSKQHFIFFRNSYNMNKVIVKLYFLVDHTSDVNPDGSSHVKPVPSLFSSIFNGFVLFLFFSNVHRAFHAWNRAQQPPGTVVMLVTRYLHVVVQNTSRRYSGFDSVSRPFPLA